MIIVKTIQLPFFIEKADMEHTYVNESGCVPLRFYR